jgi:PAS domain S-box-containing protein
MKAGAHDYLAKGSLARLAPAIERELNEASFRREQGQFNKQIVESAQEGIIVYGRDLKYQVWNPYMERLTGVPAQEVIGRHPLEVFPSVKDVGLIEMLLNALAGKNPGPIEFPFHIAGTGRRGWRADMNGALRNSAGEIIGVIATVRDITKQKMNEELEHSLARRMQAAAETERRRIARELHDSAAQQLAAALMNIGRIEKVVIRGGAKSTSILHETVGLLQRCSQDIRTLSYRLHPPLLDELGLEAALRVYTEGFSKRSSIEVSIDFSCNSPRLPRNLEMVLFRFIQEGLGNLHRHSGSRTAKIRLARETDRVIVEVADQGCGISPGDLRKIQNGVLTKGIGVAAMRGRLIEVHGRIEFESDERGTVVRAIVPLAGITDRSADAGAELARVW